MFRGFSLESVFAVEKTQNDKLASTSRPIPGSGNVVKKFETSSPLQPSLFKVIYLFNI